RRLHVFLKKLRHGIQHLRQGTRRFAHLDHLGRESRKDLRILQTGGEPFAFPYAAHRRKDGLGDAFARNGARRGFKRGNERQTAGQQCGECPREQGHLVLQPDVPKQRQFDADSVNAVRSGIGPAPAINQVEQEHKCRQSKQDILLSKISDGQQPKRDGWQLAPDLVVQLREARHDKRNQENEERTDQRNENRWIDERGRELFAESQRDSLKGQETGQDLFKVAASLASQKRGGVNHRESALRLKGRGNRLAGAHARSHILELCRKVRILLALGEHFQRTEDGQPSSNQRQKLLIEDDEGFELRFTPAARQAAGPDRIDIVAGLREALAQFFGGSSRMHLLLNTASLVGQFDYKFS